MDSRNWPLASGVGKKEVKRIDAATGSFELSTRATRENFSLTQPLFAWKHVDTLAAIV
jgi:hypothetical protein